MSVAVATEAVQMLLRSGSLEVNDPESAAATGEKASVRSVAPAAASARLRNPGKRPDPKTYV